MSETGFTAVLGDGRGLTGRDLQAQQLHEYCHNPIHQELYGPMAASVVKNFVSELQTLTQNELSQMEAVYRKNRQDSPKAIQALDACYQGYSRDGLTLPEHIWLRYDNGEVLRQAAKNIHHTLEATDVALQGYNQGYMLYLCGVALCAQELLSPASFTALYAPWQAVFGDPA
jgi:hypothetical protein